MYQNKLNFISAEYYIISVCHLIHNIKNQIKRIRALEDRNNISKTCRLSTYLYKLYCLHYTSYFILYLTKYFIIIFLSTLLSMNKPTYEWTQ